MKPLKIAYIKYNMSINLDPYNHRTSGGVLERLGILKALIEAGHKIVIYSEINSADVDFLQNPPNEFSWLKTVEYKPTVLPNYKNYDLLYIEMGPENLQFTSSIWHMPYIALTNMILSKWKGLVFYYQNDHIPFIFNIHSFEADYIKKYLRYCSNAEALIDKSWVILTKIVGEENQQKFRECYNSSRFLYDWLQPDVEFVPVSRFVGIVKEEFMKICPIEELKYELVYLGHQKGRIKKFKQYYGDMPCKVNVFGNWEDSFISDIKGSITINKPISQGNVASILNRSMASIMITNANFEKFRMTTGRFFEIIASRCIMLVDEDVLPYHDYKLFDIPREFIVSSHDEAHEKVLQLGRISEEERINILEEQYSWIKDDDPHKLYAKRFYEIYEQYKEGKAKNKLYNNYQKHYKTILEKMYNYNHMGRQKTKFILQYMKLNYDQYGLHKIRTKVRIPVYEPKPLCVSCGKDIVQKNLFYSRCTHCGCKKQRVEDVNPVKQDVAEKIAEIKNKITLKKQIEEKPQPVEGLIKQKQKYYFRKSKDPLQESLREDFLKRLKKY